MSCINIDSTINDVNRYSLSTCTKVICGIIPIVGWIFLTICYIKHERSLSELFSAIQHYPHNDRTYQIGIDLLVKKKRLILPALVIPAPIPVLPPSIPVLPPPMAVSPDVQPLSSDSDTESIQEEEEVPFQSAPEAEKLNYFMPQTLMPLLYYKTKYFRALDRYSFHRRDLVF